MTTPEDRGGRAVLDPYQPPAAETPSRPLAASLGQFVRVRKAAAGCAAVGTLVALLTLADYAKPYGYALLPQVFGRPLAMLVVVAILFVAAAAMGPRTWTRRLLSASAVLLVAPVVVYAAAFALTMAEAVVGGGYEEA